MKNYFYIQILIFGFIGSSFQEQVPNLSSVLNALFEGHDKTLSPYHILANGSRTEISVSLHINEIYKVNSQDMSYRISCFLRLLWHDPRLDLKNLTAATSIDLPTDAASKMWMPDLFFTNERDGEFHDIPAPNMWIKISQGGQIFVSRRYSMLLSCPFYLQRFPLDTQFCKLDIELYYSRTDSVVLKWRDNSGLEIPKNLTLVDFEVVALTVEAKNITYYTGNFSCLRVTFQLERKYQYYLVLIYVPAVLIVVLSWLTFWIEPEAIPARVSLGVTTVLSILTLTFLSGLAMPMVPYVKAIDVWLLISVLFVCLSFVEFIVVLVANNRTNIVEDQHRCTKYYKHILTAKRIDDISKLLFPMLWVLCTAMYWGCYILWDNKHEKKV